MRDASKTDWRNIYFVLDVTEIIYRYWTVEHIYAECTVVIWHFPTCSVSYFIVCYCIIVRHFYSTSAKLATQSVVLAIVQISVWQSVCLSHAGGYSQDSSFCATGHAPSYSCVGPSMSTTEKLWLVGSSAKFFSCQRKVNKKFGWGVYLLAWTMDGHIMHCSTISSCHRPLKLRRLWLMPIRCHLRDCNALLGLCLIHVCGASFFTFTLTFSPTNTSTASE